MYKALEVEFIRTKSANYASNNGMYIKRDNMRIKMIVLNLHDVIVDLKRVVLSEYVKPLLS